MAMVRVRKAEAMVTEMEEVERVEGMAEAATALEARVVEVALAVSLPGVAVDTMAAAMTAVEVMAVSERAAVGLVVAAAVEIHLVVLEVAATAAAEAPAAVVG